MPTLNRRRENSDPQRKQGRNNREIYQSERWHRLSRQIRAQQPLCKRCLEKGIVERAKVVDHIIPLTIWVDHYNEDPFDIINLQPLSKSCHSIKTKEDARIKDWSAAYQGVVKSRTKQESQTAGQPQFSARNV